ncbi:MAG TPA: hypothetical protein VFX29_03615 [Longimicrobiaceae bacterium]|nr:hypothetical protein [Longimicrobiaceae bacterium]
MFDLRPARRVVLLLAALAAALLGAACQQIAPTTFSADIDGLLAGGHRWAAELGGRRAAELSDADVVALGYLERARLGLGSPFRLIDFASKDPRLSAATQQHLAWAVLDLTLRGQTYQVDPAVLDGLRLSGVTGGVAVGEHHLRLIERVIAEAPTPASGERAVRLGYALAGAELTVGNAASPAVAYAAALIADRARARHDAADLLRAAAVAHAEPLALLEEWRRALRLRVEQPALAEESPREELAEARLAPRTARALRLLSEQLATPITLVDAAARPAAPASWLTPESAARLETLALGPPQAPVAVAIAINRELFTTRPGLSDTERAARTRFADAAWSDERLVAAAARLGEVGLARRPQLAMIETQAAIFLRGWNQEEPWFPGDAAAERRDLEARFGLAAIVFDDSVPAEWRPYYRRMLARGLSELQRVLPAATLRGLTIRIGAVPEGSGALAIHEPSTRTIVLPPATGAGTLAHEVAHELDRQLAQARYSRRGAYASDLVVAGGTRDRISVAMTRLAAAARTTEATGATDDRPAEVFARTVDWFVAAALAREGRTGGYLTSFQSPALPGYGSTRGPDLGASTVPALFAVLDDVAPVGPELRRWTLERYGPANPPSARATARAILAAPNFAAIGRARDLAHDALAAEACAKPGADAERALLAARRDLIRAATTAAARGAAVAAIRADGERQGGMVADSLLDDWLAWRLRGAPEPVDSIVMAMAPGWEVILQHADEVALAEPAAPGDAFSLGAQRLICGGNPFATSGSPARGRDVVQRAGEGTAAPKGVAWQDSPQGRRTAASTSRVRARPRTAS